MKSLTDQFQLCFVFALATLNNYVYFCIANTIGILPDNLLVATYAMLCPVFAFRCVMQFQSEYSVMLRLCSRCRKVVILNLFKTGITAVSFLPVFLCCALGVQFNSPVATPAHGLSPSLRLRFISKKRKLALYVCAATHGPT